MRGFVPSMLKNTLNAGSYFSCLYYFETNLRKSGLFTESQVLLCSSAMARTVQSVVFNPLVIIKTRFEVVGFKEYGSVYDACRQIVRKEGFGGFFTGLKVSLIRDIPFSSIFYPTY